MGATVMMLGMLIAMAGCEGEQMTRQMPSTVTTEGTWSFDEILYRRYDISLDEAYLHARNFFQKKEWKVVETESSLRHGRVEGEMADGTFVKIIVLAPKTGPTEVGMKVGGGDRVISAKLLDELELQMQAPRLPDEVAEEKTGEENGP